MKPLALAAAVALAAPAAHAQIANSKVCAVLGDSNDVMTGDGFARDGAWHLIQDERDVVILNQSVGGTGIAGEGGFNGRAFIQELDRLTDSPRSALDCIVITVGGNDFQRATWPEIQAGLNAILNWAGEHDAQVLMVDLLWRSRNETGASPAMGIDYATYRQRRANLCTQRSFCAFAERPPYFDRAVPNLYMRGERANDNLVHLNRAGQRRRADWIMREADEAGLDWRPTPAAVAAAEPARREAPDEIEASEDDRERGLLGRVSGIGGRLDDASHDAFGVVERLIWGDR